MNNVLIAQTDDPELLEFLAKAALDGGGFISTLARAALAADQENYPILRPALIVFRKKYWQYEPSAAVKQEIRARQGQQQP